jgi:hypothetical protein
MSGVKETTKDTAATDEKTSMTLRGRYGCVVGNTSANQRNVIGIKDADANANLAQTYPHSEPA